MSLEKSRQLYAKMAQVGIPIDSALKITEAVISSETQKRASAFSAAGELVKALGNLSGMPLMLSLGVPPAAGYMAGRNLADFFDADKSDVKELQEEELIRELRQNAHNLRIRKQLKQTPNI